MRRGDIYNGDAVEKTVEDLTVEISKHGYPFATVRPRGDRNPQTAPSASSFSSMKARAPISSASISAAIPARATMSSGASSIFPKATRTIAL